MNGWKSYLVNMEQNIKGFPESWYIKVQNREQRKFYKELFLKYTSEAKNWKYEIGYIYGFDKSRYTAGKSNDKYLSFEEVRELLNNTSPLPEKWCIKSCQELVDWSSNILHNKQNVDFRAEHQYFYNPAINFLKWKWSEYIPEGYTEITFEEFKRYVLNKDIAKESTDYLLPILKKLKII